MLSPVMLGALAGNVTKAVAGLGGIGAAPSPLLPMPIPVVMAGAGAVILLFGHSGSCVRLRGIFRWLALALFADVASAPLARPHLLALLRGTLVPHVRFGAGFLSLIVACIGTSWSARIRASQSNQELEERIGDGRTEAWQRRGASEAEPG